VASDISSVERRGTRYAHWPRMAIAPTNIPHSLA
jgi:hypothetical protein